jgi:hypothetical protein
MAIKEVRKLPVENYGNTVQIQVRMNKERLQSLARDLRKTPPRSPREPLGGFVIGARMLDKGPGRPFGDQW